MQEADESIELARLAARAADEAKGENILVLDVGDVLVITQYFVIVSAGNRRLVRTLADAVEAAAKDGLDRAPVRVEGHREQQWVLIDFGDVVVHVFLDEVRDFYEIERLYRDVPIVPWGAD
jgi:ribosome-associated protein